MPMFLDSELFDDYYDRGVEPKLELIDHQLIVGNSLMGTRLLLSHILRGWGAEAAVAMTPPSLWIEALRSVYSDMPTDDTPRWQWWRWASQLSYNPPDLTAGSATELGDDRSLHDHKGIRNRLSYQLFGITNRQRGQTFGHDFVMRLGENGFTPDVSFICGQTFQRLHHHYLDGAADLVIEVLLPKHQQHDREIKRRYYEAAGIPEYWLIDFVRRSPEFLRLVDGQYQPQSLTDEGLYRPASVPGLVFNSGNLWDAVNDPYSVGSAMNPENPVFWVERQQATCLRDRPFHAHEPGVTWGDLPFVPRLALEPVPVQFEEFISWCPEAKFEYMDGKPCISGATGIQHLIGMALMSIGLREAVQLLPPDRWLNAIFDAQAFYHHDEARRYYWWKYARLAAEVLREKHGATRLGVIGDLVNPTPLNVWSTITIVAWDLPDRSRHEASYDLYLMMNDPKVHLLEADRVTKSQQAEIDTKLVEL